LAGNLLAESKTDLEEPQQPTRTLETIIALKEIDIKIKHGEFVCVIGDVGSGKSSMLSALIGELLYVSP